MRRISVIVMTALLAAACTSNPARHALPSAEQPSGDEAPPQGRVLADFSDASDVENWVLYRVAGVERSPRVAVVDGALRVTSDRAAGLFFHDCHVDVELEPLIGWRWRVSEVFVDASPYTPGRDNFPARVLIGFDASWEGADELSLHWKRKVEEICGRTPPARALCYTFGGNQPAGEAVDALIGLGRIVVINLRPPTARAGHWYSEIRNVAADYAAVFGRRAPAVTHLAVTADTQRVERKVEADFDDFTAWPVRAAGALAARMSEPVTSHGHAPLGLMLAGVGAATALALAGVGAVFLWRRREGVS